MVKLAMRPREHDPDTFLTTLSTLMSPSASIYDKGLAAWAVGRLLQIPGKHDRFYFKKQLLDQAGSIMDAMVDIIGEAKEIARVAEAEISSLPSTKRKSKRKHVSRPTVGPTPSQADCAKISKNCSLTIVMLSRFLSEEVSTVTTPSSHILLR